MPITWHVVNGILQTHSTRIQIGLYHIYLSTCVYNKSRVVPRRNRFTEDNINLFIKTSKRVCESFAMKAVSLSGKSQHYTYLILSMTNVTPISLGACRVGVLLNLRKEMWFNLKAVPWTKCDSAHKTKSIPNELPIGSINTFLHSLGLGNVFLGNALQAPTVFL